MNPVIMAVMHHEPMLDGVYFETNAEQVPEKMNCVTAMKLLSLGS
jgi:hypothetical protein